jgi:hypothetical protein
MDSRIEQLKPETIDKLAEKAHAAGLSLDVYLNTLLGLLNDGTALSELSDEQFQAVMDEFSRGSEDIPPLPSDFSRADIYSNHD